MRALVQPSSNPTEWFLDLEPNSLGKTLAAIAGKVILLSDGKAKEERIACLTSLPDRSKDLIIGFMTESLWGRGGRETPDLVVGVDGETINVFDDYESFRVIDQIVKNRSRGSKKGDPSLDYLRRVILPFAKVSSKVEVFDKWIAGMLLNDQFLPLTELLAIPDLEISFFTGIAKNDIEDDLVFDKRSMEIEFKFESVISKARGESSNSSITRLNTLFIQGKDLHNRWIVFHLLENKTLIGDLNKGLVEFSPERLSETTSVTLIEDPFSSANVRNEWHKYRTDLPRKTSSWCGRVRF